MKYTFITLLLFILMSSYSNVQAQNKCYWYNPKSGSKLKEFCPNKNFTKPADMVWPDYLPQSGTANGSSNSNIDLSHMLNNPGAYTYWRKSQTLLSGHGDKLGNVYVQREANQLNISFEVNSNNCYLRETRMDVSINLYDLSTRLSGFNYISFYRDHTVYDKYSVNVSDIRPDEKHYIAVYALVRCQDTNDIQAWSGAHEDSNYPFRYITYKAVSPDNPPIARY